MMLNLLASIKASSEAAKADSRRHCHCSMSSVSYSRRRLPELEAALQATDPWWQLKKSYDGLYPREVTSYLTSDPNLHIDMSDEHVGLYIRDIFKTLWADPKSYSEISVAEQNLAMDLIKVEHGQHLSPTSRELLMNMDGIANNPKFHDLAEIFFKDDYMTWVQEFDLINLCNLANEHLRSISNALDSKGDGEAVEALKNLFIYKMRAQGYGNYKEEWIELAIEMDRSAKYGEELSHEKKVLLEGLLDHEDKNIALAKSFMGEDCEIYQDWYASTPQGIKEPLQTEPMSTQDEIDALTAEIMEEETNELAKLEEIEITGQAQETTNGTNTDLTNEVLDNMNQTDEATGDLLSGNPVYVHKASLLDAETESFTNQMTEHATENAGEAGSVGVGVPGQLMGVQTEGTDMGTQLVQEYAQNGMDGGIIALIASCSVACVVIVGLALVFCRKTKEVIEHRAAQL